MDMGSGFEGIEIRKAVSTDVERIWDILHAESYGWDNDTIEKRLSGLYVLVRSGAIIAVACVASRQDRLFTEWTAVHPMHPEKQTADILRKAIAIWPPDLAVFKAISRFT